jgi:hypothetical protein
MEAERLDLIHRLDTTMKVTDTGVEIAMDTHVAVSMVKIASMPTERQPSTAEIFQAMERYRPQLTNAVRMQTRVALLYTYQGASWKEIAECIALGASPTGTNYHNISVCAYKRALLEGSFKWGAHIAELLRQAKSQTEL